MRFVKSWYVILRRDRGEAYPRKSALWEEFFEDSEEAGLMREREKSLDWRAREFF